MLLNLILIYSLDDGSRDVYTSEFVWWPSKVKLFICASLKAIHKKQQEDYESHF